MTRFRVGAGANGGRTAYGKKKGQAAHNIKASGYEVAVNTAFLSRWERMVSTHDQSSWALQQYSHLTHPATGPVVRRGRAQHATSMSIMGE
jgi:hypothetical protein